MGILDKLKDNGAKLFDGVFQIIVDDRGVKIARSLTECYFALGSRETALKGLFRFTPTTAKATLRGIGRAVKDLFLERIFLFLFGCFPYHVVRVID